MTIHSVITKQFNKLAKSVGVLALLTGSVVTASVYEFADPAISPTNHSSVQAPLAANAFVALLGLESASDKDMMSTGHDILTTYHQAFQSKTLNNLANDWDEVIHNHQGVDRTWLKSIAPCNTRKGGSCLQVLSNTVNPVTKHPERLTLLLNRYQQILNMTYFEEVQQVSDLMPQANYGYMGKLSTIKKAHLFQTGEYLHLMELISLENQFWRRVLTQGNSLIAKMVAISNIWTNTTLVAELHTLGVLDNELQNHLKSLLAPLSAEALDISEAFDYELQYTLGAIKQGKGHESLLVEPDKTIHTLQEFYVAPLKCLSKLSKSEFKVFYAERDNAPAIKACEINHLFANNEAISRILYQATGNEVNIASSVIAVSDYIARVHDLNGMLEMVNKHLFSDSKSLSNHDLIAFDCLNPDSVCQLPIR